MTEGEVLASLALVFEGSSRDSLRELETTHQAFRVYKALSDHHFTYVLHDDPGKQRLSLTLLDRRRN